MWGMIGVENTDLMVNSSRLIIHEVTMPTERIHLMWIITEVSLTFNGIKPPNNSYFCVLKF